MKESGLNLEAARDLFTTLYLIAGDVKTPEHVREQILFCLTAFRKGLPKYGGDVSRERLNDLFFDLLKKAKVSKVDFVHTCCYADECVDNLRLFFRYESETE